MKSRVINLCIMLFMAQSMMAQLTSLGVIGKTLTTHPGYEIEFHGDYLYAASSHGLYQYNLNDETDGWKKLAITDSAVIDFEVRGDTIITLTDYQLYTSIDGGKTKDSISVEEIRPYWKYDLIEKTFTGLAAHPSSMRKLHVALKRGLFYTEDGGTSWMAVDSLMSIEDLVYNPLDEKNLIGHYNGNGAIVYVSTDGGFQWEKVKGHEDYSLTKTFKNAAFHPEEKNRIVMCGDGIYAMSIDQGYSWTTIEDPEHPFVGTQLLVYLDYILYDSRNPNILYGADWSYVQECKIPILRSKDGGFSWETFYTINTKEPSGVDCMCMRENMLVIYTERDNEVLLLDVDAVEMSISPVVNGEGTSPYYDLMGRKVAHPTRGIYIKDGRKVIVE